MTITTTDLNANFGTMVNMTLKDVLDNGPELTALLYDKKLLAIRGLGELTTDQLWDVHACFGKPWTRRDYAASIKETLSEETEGKNVAYFGTDIYNKNVKAANLAWHRDIPWHRQIRYPIRSLYAHDSYQTPTHFADCDALWRLPDTFTSGYENVELKIQYWYYRQYDTSERRHHVRTKYVPFVEHHPGSGRHTALLNTFGSLESEEYRSKYPFMSALQAAWILGIRVNGEDVPEDDYLAYMNTLHTEVCKPENIVTWTYEKNDLVLFDNLSGVFHSRDNVNPLDGKRSFYRMNVRHNWQNERAIDL